MKLNATVIGARGEHSQKDTTIRPGRTVLLVQIAAENSRRIGVQAATTGHRLLVANNLAEAKRHLAIYRPDLVIIDLELPGTSALSLIRQIAGQSAPRPYVAALANPKCVGMRSLAMAAGIGVILDKPLRNLSVIRHIHAQAASQFGVAG